RSRRRALCVSSTRSTVTGSWLRCTVVCQHRDSMSVPETLSTTCLVRICTEERGSTYLHLNPWLLCYDEVDEPRVEQTDPFHCGNAGTLFEQLGARPYRYAIPRTRAVRPATER